MSRRGVTVIELLVAMVVGLVVIGAAAPLLTLGSRSVEQQRSAREVQASTHVAAEVLIRGIRDAEGVLDGASQTRLLLEGGPLAAPCGGDPYWIEGADGELQCGPEGEGASYTITRNATEALFEYGIDVNDDGSVDSFQNSVTSSNEDDVLAVRFELTLTRSEGQRDFENTAEFLAVIRTAVLDRLELES